jgi:hypothetical protein
MGMLALDFIRVPVMGHTIQSHLKHLGLRARQPQLAIGTLFDVGVRNCARHCFASRFRQLKSRSSPEILPPLYRGVDGCKLEE